MDLIECSNCHSWFADASADEVFYHATCACCRDREIAAPSPNDHILGTSFRN
jgi:hypothetical protein